MHQLEQLIEFLKTNEGNQYWQETNKIMALVPVVVQFQLNLVSRLYIEVSIPTSFSLIKKVRGRKWITLSKKLTRSQNVIMRFLNQPVSRIKIETGNSNNNSRWDLWPILPGGRHWFYVLVSMPPGIFQCAR